MKIAVFPGSFDPITIAHFDLIQRGLDLFDKVVVAVGINTSKTGMFDHDERVEMIRASLSELPSDRVDVVRFQGLTVDLCHSLKASFILRGMRSVLDFESERAIALNNLELAPEIQSVFLLSQGMHSHISSTIIREIIASGGRVDHLVPHAVSARIHASGESSELPNPL